MQLLLCESIHHFHPASQRQTTVLEQRLSWPYIPEAWVEISQELNLAFQRKFLYLHTPVQTALQHLVRIGNSAFHGIEKYSPVIYRLSGGIVIFVVGRHDIGVFDIMANLVVQSFVQVEKE